MRTSLCSAHARRAPRTTCTSRRTHYSAAASTASASCASTHMHIATGRREGGCSTVASHAAFCCAGDQPSAATPLQRAEPDVHRALRAYVALLRTTKWLARKSAWATMALVYLVLPCVEGLEARR